MDGFITLLLLLLLLLLLNPAAVRVHGVKEPLIFPGNHKRLAAAKATKRSRKQLWQGMSQMWRRHWLVPMHKR